MDVFRFIIIIVILLLQEFLTDNKYYLILSLFHSFLMMLFTSLYYKENYPHFVAKDCVDLDKLFNDFIVR